MKLITKLSQWSFLSLILLLPFRAGYVFLDQSPLVGGGSNDIVAPAVFLFDILLLASVALAIIANYTPKRPIVEHGTTINWLVLAIIGLLLIIQTIPPRDTFAMWYPMARVGMIICATWLAFHHVKHISNAVILKTFVASGIIQALIGLGQYIKQGSLGLRYLGESILAPTLSGVAKVDLDGEKLIRAYGTFGHSNQLAAFLLVACVTVFILLAKSETTKEKTLYVFILLLIILGVSATLSRSVLIALPFVLGALYALLSNQKGRRLAAITSLASICIAAFIFAAPLSTRWTITDNATLQRIDYNQRGVEIIKENPLFGAGIGNTLGIIEKNYAYEEAWQIQPPHNYFILLAVEMGLVGLTLIIILFAWLLKNLWPAAKQRGENMDIFLFVSFSAFIFLMFFDHYFYTLPQTQLLLWLIVGMGLGRIKKPPLEAEVKIQ